MFTVYNPINRRFFLNPRCDLMFANRHDAGIELASALMRYRGQSGIVVIGIPRGGVVVAGEVARFLDAPLEVVIIKKLGYPGNPELALGAASPDAFFLNEDLARTVPKDYIDEEVKVKQREALERVSTLRGSHKPINLAGKIAIVVDDGIATGASMMMAIKVLRNMKPASIVVAVPVAPPDSVRELKQVADEVVTIMQPRDFFAIGQFYSDFTQVSDEETKKILDEGGSGKRASR
jgi:putative phosphoribosyl transferase